MSASILFSPRLFRLSQLESSMAGALAALVSELGTWQRDAQLWAATWAQLMDSLASV
jgi:hypothetical protein